MSVLLHPRHKKILDAVLIQYPYRYFAFGSRTTGKARDYSDLDICIMGNISVTDFSTLKEHTLAQPLPFSVDLVVWDRCSEEFKETIKTMLVPYVPDLYLGAKTQPLHHVLSPHTPTWNGACGFKLDVPNDNSEQFFCVQKISMNASLGTHIDSPAHIFEHGTILDFEQKHTFSWCYIWHNKKNIEHPFSITQEDLQLFEQECGPFAPGSWILFMTGWGKRFHDVHAYRNIDQKGIMQFPTLSPETTDFFIKHNIAGIGIDTLSPDPEDGNYAIHKALLSSGKHIIENIAYHPTNNSFGYLLINPLPIHNATESPIRLLFISP